MSVFAEPFDLRRTVFVENVAFFFVEFPEFYNYDVAGAEPELAF